MKVLTKRQFAFTEREVRDLLCALYNSSTLVGGGCLVPRHTPKPKEEIDREDRQHVLTKKIEEALR
jgi:hypothetical protein